MIRELTTKRPIVDLRVFRNRTYSAGVTLITIVGVVLYGSLVLLPVFLQTLLGYPALQAGIAMAPRGLGSFLAMPLVGMFVARVDPRKLLAVGIAGAAWTLYDLSTLESGCGVLGHLLAAVLAGDLAGDALRAADDRDDGLDPARRDGQRDQPVQLHAQHRRELRDRARDDAARADQQTMCGPAR